MQSIRKSAVNVKYNNIIIIFHNLTTIFAVMYKLNYDMQALILITLKLLILRIANVNNMSVSHIVLICTVQAIIAIYGK